MNAYRNIRLFERNWMEAFSHVHPIVPLLIWGPIAVFLGVRGVRVSGGGLGEIALCASLSLLAFSLMEYLMHRYLFHFNAKSVVGKRLVYLLHGIHHDEPQDPTRLVMPPFVSVILGIIIYPIFRVVLGDWGDLAFAFFVLGYLIYDYIHFAIHHFRPRTFIGQFLKQHHMLHHFAGSEARWGVSSPLWDWVLGTRGKPPGAR